MAITCVSTISPIDIPNKIVRVDADITNDTEVTQHVVIQNADISTAPKKVLVADILWAKYLYQRNKQLQLEAIQDEIDALESQLNSNIEGRTI